MVVSLPPGDANDFLRKNHFPFVQNVVVGNYEVVGNFEAYEKSFLEKMDSIDLDDLDDFDVFEPLSVPLEIHTVAKNVNNKKGTPTTLLGGTLTKASLVLASEKVSLEDEVKVLYFTSAKRGTLEWIIQDQRMSGTKMNLTVISEGSDSSLENYLKTIPRAKINLTYRIIPVNSVVRLKEKYDFIYSHMNVGRLQEAGLLNHYLSSLRPKGVFSGTAANASRISTTTNHRDYQGIDVNGDSVTSYCGTIQTDSVVNYSTADPRLVQASLEELTTHPFFGGATPKGGGEYVGTDAFFFLNDLPPKVVLPQPTWSLDYPPLKKFSDLLTKGIDHPVPASLYSVVNTGHPFFVKRKEDGETFMMLSSLNGENVAVMKGTDCRLARGKEDFSSSCLTQWELMPNGEFKFSRPSSIRLNNNELPYNFKQLLRFVAPAELKNFRSTCSGLETLVIEEGLVLTNPCSMRPNYSYSKIGASMYVKSKNTLDVERTVEGKKMIVEVQVPDELGQAEKVLRNRPDKSKPNSTHQAIRIRNAISMKEFLGVAPVIGSVFPASNQLSTLAEVSKIRETLLTNSIDYQDLVDSVPLTEEKDVISSINMFNDEKDEYGEWEV